ncbi:MAG: riboflavin biosynthesis protein RibF [Clostridia bacterium]|nr:riboflavin biosynthesis protein RibF [Clostridia bacterium]
MFKTDKRLCSDCLLALGNFDGIHKGHRAVLEKALFEAEKRGLVPAVLLFDEHPKKVLFGEAPPSIITESDKREQLSKMGFSIVTASFSEIQNLSAAEFITKIYCSLNVRAISCGYNYRFGKDAQGDTSLLKTECEKLGISLFVAPETIFEGEAISSTRIRNALQNGEIKNANAMLGREFSYCIEVVSGDRRGRLLGFPTINQFFPPNFVKLRKGVYASKVELSHRWYPAVTNIGTRPTVDGESFRSETCILGFSGDLYGAEVEVFLLDFLRDETKFDSVETLTDAISRDAKKAREIYEATEEKI